MAINPTQHHPVSAVQKVRLYGREKKKLYKAEKDTQYAIRFNVDCREKREIKISVKMYKPSTIVDEKNLDSYFQQKMIFFLSRA